ncbi:FimB/Mfa2 family fimbrial subunit [Bacteroides sp. 519]|uniref:FimB/Mfa2 family fimbrial subunit n=1 Tax=Bacteroides sp. 519 TaxID=2302937 RepID=UPI0013D6E3D2|nr:FimB/Mfa2 family fimbrial subunit [Bacteroides sp. 519]NDV60269.1 hypothetical protein [Bacteroides sp. 519]
MKLLKKISSFFLLTCLLNSCIGDDLSSCAHTMLYFEYPDFPTRIEQVHIGIYNQEGVSVYYNLINKASLQQFQGVAVRLPEGEYTSICWGNAFEETNLLGLKTGAQLDDHILRHPASDTGESICTNDSIFYNQHTFVVPHSRDSEEYLPFVPAHITFLVYIQGMEQIYGNTRTPADELPYIRFNNLYTEYDWQMITCGYQQSYYPRMEYQPELGMAQTKLHVLRFEDENKIEVDLVDNTTSNQTLYTLNLQEFLTYHAISIEHGKEYTIPITFVFEDGNIRVIMDTWGNVPLEPEI